MSTAIGRERSRSAGSLRTRGLREHERLVSVASNRRSMRTKVIDAKPIRPSLVSRAVFAALPLLAAAGPLVSVYQGLPAIRLVCALLVVYAVVFLVGRSAWRRADAWLLATTLAIVCVGVLSLRSLRLGADNPFFEFLSIVLALFTELAGRSWQRRNPQVYFSLSRGGSSARSWCAWCRRAKSPAVSFNRAISCPTDLSRLLVSIIRMPLPRCGSGQHLDDAGTARWRNEVASGVVVPCSDDVSSPVRDECPVGPGHVGTPHGVVRLEHDASFFLTTGWPGSGSHSRRSGPRSIGRRTARNLLLCRKIDPAARLGASVPP